MKRTGWIGITLLVLAGILVSAVITGCENAADTTAGLTLEPSFLDLGSSSSSSNTTSTATGGTQTFNVTAGLRDLSLPLKWSVSNPSLGYIGSSGGTSASYVRTTAHGENAVTVEDQYGARAVATVRQ